jgi:hypothetical protein
VKKKKSSDTKNGESDLSPKTGDSSEFDRNGKRRLKRKECEKKLRLNYVRRYLPAAGKERPAPLKRVPGCRSNT